MSQSIPREVSRFLVLVSLAAGETGLSEAVTPKATQIRSLSCRLNDTAYPQYSVLFERHSDTRIKTSKLNGQERDEWFDRIRAWTGQVTVR